MSSPDGPKVTLLEGVEDSPNTVYPGVGGSTLCPYPGTKSWGVRGLTRYGPRKWIENYLGGEIGRLKCTS